MRNLNRKIIERNTRIFEDLKQFITKVDIPSPSEEISLESLTQDILGELLISVVAICHNTKLLKGISSGVEKKGWDYLLDRFYHAQRRNSVFRPIKLAIMNVETLKDIIRDEKGQWGKVLEAARMGRQQELGD